MSHIEVVAAVIINNGEILCMQRNIGKYDYVSYKYEFPGGKLESGESQEQALMRELFEEMDLNIIVSQDDFFIKVEHTYPDFSITMHSYICHVDNRTFTRREHISHTWLKNKGLLISAAGTGKTYLYAFDAKIYQPKKLLFIVHRENITRNAMKSFAQN